MAGDWMKVEKATPDKPEMALLARKLKCTQGEAFLNWFRVYSWADGITDSGLVPHLSPDEGDTLARACPGTCAALASKEIGWLRISNGGITIGNWTRHNGKSAKSRVLEAEKKRNQRKKCPDTNGTNTGPEKRREEKSNKKENTKRKSVFQKPTFEQVSAYCIERGNGIDPQSFIDHYDRVGWVVGRNKTAMKDWMAAVRTWEHERKKRKSSRLPTDEEDANWNPVDGGLG